MLTCKQMVELASDQAEGALDGSTRRDFDDHLIGCVACAAYVRQLGVARQALRRLPEPALAPGLTDALGAGFDEWAAGGAAEAPPGWRFSPWPVLSTAGVAVLLLAFARQRSQAPGDWAIGAALAAAALAVASVAGRLATRTVVVAVAAAVAAALAGGRAGGLQVATGAECLGLELASAGLVAGAAWLGLRGSARPAARAALAAGALAGALAADGALQLTCHAHGSLPHLLAFHLGGVALAAAAAWVVMRSAGVPVRP